ncbi:hypothetical protein BZA77DRAFT_326262 [Pyronema omphalodes]|nr:hypothetical protein BZA77DRAFT_326262 [Pyronema omphalodes]
MLVHQSILHIFTALSIISSSLLMLSNYPRSFQRSNIRNFNPNLTDPLLILRSLILTRSAPALAITILLFRWYHGLGMIYVPSVE